MGIKYRTGQGTSASDFTDLVVKVGDTLPIGTEVDYDGQTAPAGWQEVDDPNVYSTTEQVIGKWIDGKPLYRKTMQFQTEGSPTVTWHNIAHNISNVDFIMIKNVNFVYGNESYIVVGDASALQIVKVGKTNVSYYSKASTFFMTVILEYTKTTD